MKLNNNQNSNLIISSNDILVTANKTKLLTDVINEQDEKINSLEQNVKWLYKYGGTGSKGSGGGGGSTPQNTIDLSCNITFGNNIITKDVEKIILSNSGNIIPLVISLKRTNPLNTYQVRITHNNTTSKWQLLDDNNDYTLSMNVNVENIDSAYIKIEIRGAMAGSSGTDNDQYMFKYVSNPYNISLNVLKADDSNILNNNDLYYDIANSNDVKLKINYSLESSNEIEYEILQTNMFSNSTGIINENHKGVGFVDIPFDKEFLSNKDNIGLQTITVLFSIPYDETIGLAAHTITKELSFTYIPDNGVFFKITPINSNEKIYKYNATNYEVSLSLYNDYTLYFSSLQKLSNKTFFTSENEEDRSLVYNKLNIDESTELSETELTNIINSECASIESKLYIFNPGTLSLNVQAYKGDVTNGTIDIHCVSGINDQLETININIDTIQYRRNQLVSIPIYSEGIYKFSIYSETMAESEKIYYYVCVLNKNNLLNWYTTGTNFMLNCYYRAGEVSPHQSIQKFKNSVYIQQYSSAGSNQNTGEIQLLHIDEKIQNKEDILVSLGFQYSEINNFDNPILSIDCKNASTDETKSNISLYQNKITLGNSQIGIFLPKESDYNPSDKSKYHLLNIYKRYVYTANTKHYEVCVYLDGCLEGAFQSFTDDSSGWDTITLSASNISVNLFELSYLEHNETSKKRFNDNGDKQILTYLDDIAISEYYYKYVNTILNNSANVSSYEDALTLLDELRSFKETDNGMMEVNHDPKNNNVIGKIAENIPIPVIMFHYNDTSDNDFISRFTKTYTEGFGDSSTFILDGSTPLYYSPGKKELKLISIPQAISSAYWYISLQGSSTGEFFDKNLTLGIKTNDTGVLPIFTPNFMYLSKEEFNKVNPTSEELQKIQQARDSYLPETAFTLKADCVDSTHSNNTAVGKFVNENTTPFDIKFKGNNGLPINGTTCTYINYIKNCLLGYACLVFIEVSNKEKTASKYYYLGIYNFNLGRDSYFNMGYYSPQYLEQEQCNKDLMSLTTGDEFKVTYITLAEGVSELPVSDGVIVAEIQGGNPRYDFSQYNPTMLLPQSANDKGAMFGDFVPAYDYKSSTGPSGRIKYHLQRLVQGVSKAGGWIFESVLRKHLGEYDWGYSKYINDGEYSSIFESANQVPNFRVQYERNINVDKDKPNYYDIVKNNNAPYIDSIIYDATALYYLISTNKTDDGSMAYGRPEPVLDYVSVSEYYTVCMAFGLVDSVMKNLNVKTWNSTYVDSTDPDVNNVGKWYVAFYDMDTSFGRDNKGSKISYFAFSDYWKTDTNSTSLTSAIIYRDFFPAENKMDPNVKDQHIPESDAGFDVPSSYLFAIAKYAPLVGVENFGPDFGKSTPQNIWARWRCVISSDNNNAVGPGKGELKNANYFIDKYFIRNLDDIPEQLWTTNFRFKYLKRINKPNEDAIVYMPDTVSGMFETKNYTPFHGKGIYELREWLNGRFHILDAYFNLEGSNTSIQYLTYENIDENGPYKIEEVKENDTVICYKYVDNQKPVKNGMTFKWNTINAGETNLFDTIPLIDSNTLSGNTDIYILQDIFNTTGQGIQYKSDLNLIIKAQKYSPLVIHYAQGEVVKYLLNNPNVEYSIYKQNTGVQEFKFGGSLLWTYIKNYNSLIHDNQITVTSPRLDSFTLTSGICGTYNISNMRSLKTILIEKGENDDYSQFTGTLNISPINGKEMYPALESISLIRTNITLLINNSGVKNINLSRTTSEHATQIINCNNLESVNLSYFKTSQSLTITPGWSNNMKISDTSIKKMVLSPKSKTGERKITIENDNVLESLVLDGFTHIYITNCSNLFDICIKNPKEVQVLEIIGAARNTSQDKKYLYIHNNSDDTYEGNPAPGTINLNAFENLNEFSFYNTRGFSIIDIHEKDDESCQSITINDIVYKIINIKHNAFNNTNLEQILIDPNIYLYINGNDDVKILSTFYNSYYGAYPNNMIIGKDVEKLDDMFHFNSETGRQHKGIGEVQFTPGFAAVFLQNAKDDNYEVIFENIDNIKSLKGLFHGQTDIISSSIDTNLSLWHFKNVNDISYIFYNTGITIASNKLFIKENSDNSINCVGENIMKHTTNNPTGGIINIACCIPLTCKITIDFFKPLINNIELLISDNPSYVNYNLQIINDQGSDINQLTITDLFEGLDYENNKIKYIYGFNIKNDIAIDFENLLYEFNENSNGTIKFPKLSQIVNSFNSENINNTNCNLIGLKEYPLVKLTQSFIFSNQMIDRFNITNFINFEGTLQNNFSLYTAEGSLGGAKEIDDTDIIKILKKLNEVNCKDISSLFSNTIIYTDRDIIDYNYELELSETNIIYNFTKCHKLFESSKLVNRNSGEEIGFTITQNTLKGFKNVTNWSNAFENCILHKNLPLNMFNLMMNKPQYEGHPYVIDNYETKISDMSGMFRNVKLDKKPGSSSWFEYDWNSNDPGFSYNNNVQLDGSYHYDIDTLVGIKIDNPTSYDKTLINANEYIYGTNITKNLILPWDIFYGGISSVNVDGFIESSDFEGILPSNLFAGRLQSNMFKNTFKETLVIPNKVGTVNIQTKMKYELPDLGEAKDCNAYIFVPSGFTKSQQLNESFNFKVLLPNSKHVLEDESDPTILSDNLETYFIFNYDSFDINTLKSLKNSLPNVVSETIPLENGEYTERSIYKIDTRKNDNLDKFWSFNTRWDYGIHYYLNLYKGVLNTVDTYIDPNETGLSFTDLRTSMRNTMFNSDIMGLIYGALVSSHDPAAPIDIVNIQTGNDNTYLCQCGSTNKSNGISYNIILPLNGGTNRYYEKALEITAGSTIYIAEHNIYNKHRQSLENYCKGYTNSRIQEETIDINYQQ